MRDRLGLKLIFLVVTLALPMQAYGSNCRGRISNLSAKAFTLTEVLVSMAVIGTLVAIAIPTLSKVRHRARDTVCLSNLRQICLVTLSYENEYKCLPNQGPNGMDLSRTIEMLPEEAWRCPADRNHEPGQRYFSYMELWTRYMLISDTTQGWNPRAASVRYENNPRLPLYQDLQPWHKHRNQVFYDGHAERSRD